MEPNDIGFASRKKVWRKVKDISKLYGEPAKFKKAKAKPLSFKREANINVDLNHVEDSKKNLFASALSSNNEFNYNLRKTNNQNQTCGTNNQLPNVNLRHVSDDDDEYENDDDIHSNFNNKSSSFSADKADAEIDDTSSSRSASGSSSINGQNLSSDSTAAAASKLNMKKHQVFQIPSTTTTTSAKQKQENVDDDEKEESVLSHDPPSKLASQTVISPAIIGNGKINSFRCQKASVTTATATTTLSYDSYPDAQRLYSQQRQLPTQYRQPRVLNGGITQRHTQRSVVSYNNSLYNARRFKMRKHYSTNIQSYTTSKSMYRYAATLNATQNGVYPMAKWANHRSSRPFAAAGKQMYGSSPKRSGKRSENDNNYYKCWQYNSNSLRGCPRGKSCRWLHEKYGTMSQ